jgi:hypothetical protein
MKEAGQEDWQMLETADGKRTQLQKDDLISFRRERGENRIYIYRQGKPLRVNGKDHFVFPKAKNLAEQFEWMCWFADAVGTGSLVRFGPPGQIMVSRSETTAVAFEVP